MDPSSCCFSQERLWNDSTTFPVEQDGGKEPEAIPELTLPAPGNMKTGEDVGTSTSDNLMLLLKVMSVLQKHNQSGLETFSSTRLMPIERIKGV